MPNNPKKGGGANRPGKPRLILQGFEGDETPAELKVLAFDAEGSCIASVEVADDGTFDLKESVLEEAHRVRIGPGGEAGDAAPDSAYLTYRAVDFGQILERGPIRVDEGIWGGWLPLFRCVSGSVRRCYPSPWWYRDLARFAAESGIAPVSSLRNTRLSVAPSRLEAATRFSPALDIDDLILWPRCHAICLGTVEVYRRVCCCEPWIVYDPRLPGLLEELEDIVQGLPEVGPPRPPGPQPDPAPIRDTFLRGGALDRKAVNARRDLVQLRSLSAERVPAYVNDRPYLLCRSYSCDPPVKVAEGTIGPDGRFNVCWLNFSRALGRGCHEELAYRVKQRIGPFTVTIYDGVAAGHWHDADDEPVLRSYHPLAIACRDNGGEGDAFVYLDIIGDTGSEHLGTPDQDGADSVQTPGPTGGVAFPTGGPPGGSGENRNWGGTLKLNVMFSESMRDVGARYYRIGVTRANGNGDPVGDPQYIQSGLSWTKAVATPGGVDVVPVSLGPNAVGGQDYLYEIPYDRALPLNEDWEAGQYHAHLDTADVRWSGPATLTDPAVRHLVTIEVFDASGERLRPNGTPVTGLGGAESEAAFTYRRKFQATGPTNMVPFGALTHLFWWDNREVAAVIEDLRMNGVESDEECQFMVGTPSSTFGIGYRAYHPEELFQRDHSITWKRGLSGGSGTILPATHANRGVPPAPAHPSPTATFADMLEISENPNRTKCAFTVFLTTVNKRTDGDDLGYGSAHTSAAFALEIA